MTIASGALRPILLATCAFPLLAQTAHAQSTSTEGSVAVEEVIVTAQRRAESLQSVPVAVTAMSAEQMAEKRVDSVASISRVSPSISFDVSNNAAQAANIVIRGIGTIGSNRAFEGAVGVFVDGVYRARPGQVMQNWLDLDSVQVLRGPQGTLFGKNTSAGALLLGSTAPSFGSAGGTYEATYGDYNTVLTRGAVNLPVNDKLSLRMAGLWTSNEGYIENPKTGEDYNDHHAAALKFQALWEPTDDLSLRLIADWSKSKENCCYGTVQIQSGATDAVIRPLAIANGFNQPAAPSWKDYKAFLNPNPEQINRDRGVALITDWSIGPGVLHSTTAYRKWNFNELNKDADFSGADILNLDEFFRMEDFSQEFVYSGDFSLGERQATYVFGAFYAHEKLRNDRKIYWGQQAGAFFGAFVPAAFGEALPGLWASEYYSGRSRSLGAFTQWTVELTDQLKLIAGARYSDEQKQAAFHNTYFRGAFPPAAPPYPVFYVIGVMPAPAYEAENDDKAVSGTAGLQYQLSARSMAYVTYSRGFKAGGVNLDSNAAGGVANNAAVPSLTGVQLPPADPVYKPEFTDGLEAGLKVDYLDGRARTNVAIFYDRIKDLQVAQFLGLQYAILNAPKGTSAGAEIENTFKVDESVTLEAAATWLPEAKFGDDASIGGLSGRRFAHAPKLTVTLGALLDRPITNGLNVTGRAGMTYTTRIFTNAANNFQQGDVTLLDLGVGVRSPGQGWRLEVWCQNCTDERYVTQHFNPPLQNIADPITVNAYVGLPRRYGVTLRGEF